MGWQARIKKLQESIGITTDEMAQLLGISVRTLGDFTRPDGRQPSEPVQKLIEFLEKENGISSENNIKSNTILILINSDFYENHKNIVETIEKMVKDDETSVKDYHFIYTGLANKIPLSFLQKHRTIKPHYFFLGEGESNESHADVSYFSLGSSALIRSGIRRNVSHVVVAADYDTFYPLSLSYNDNAIIPDNDMDSESDSEVFFTYISNGGYEESSKVKVIKPNINDTRYTGKIISKHDRYGFISPTTESKGELITNNNVFFSVNSIRKTNNILDIKISELSVGDTVSFNFGLNNKGICAIDMILIKAGDATNNEKRSIAMLKTAINDCVDDTGYALLSNVGGRLSIITKDYKDILKEDGYEDIGSVCRENGDIFDYHQNGVGKHRAACVRVR